MSGLFQGPEIGKRSLLTEQLAMFTRSHRLANVKSPGVAPQPAIVEHTLPQDLPGNRIGTGMTRVSIHQLRDTFVEMQFRREANSLGGSQVQSKVLSQLERVFTQPQGHAMGDLLTRFWNSWRELAQKPSGASRAAVTEQADLLINGFRTATRQLNHLESSLNREPEIQPTTLDEGRQLALQNEQIARDVWLPESREAFDCLAQTLVTEVNRLHVQGVTADGRAGQAFFDPRYVTADKIQLHSTMADNPQQNIVAGRTTAGHDVEIAQSLADLAETPVLPDGRTTLNGYWDSVVGTVGTRSMEARDVTDTQTLLVEQLESHRQSVMGASLDEELAQMIKFQHAYEAAARVITTMDEAMSSVMNGMGLAGR